MNEHFARRHLDLLCATFSAFVFAAASASLAAPPDESPVLATFAEAKKAYAAKNWDSAEAALRRMAELLSAPGMDSARTRALPAYYFYSAAVAFQKKDEERCREQLLRYFSTSPEAGVDPASYPKRFVRIFEATREKAAEVAPPTAAGEIAGGVLPSYATRDVDVAAIPANTGEPGWADGPASALLTDVERRAFGALTDDDDRRSFVARFWAGLDPSPESADNELQLEFYRRVQYADANFSTEATRGSLTDRGRVLLVLGPPSYASRAPIRSGNDQMTVMRSTETILVRTANGPVSVRVANPKGATPGGLEGEMEIWVYRGDRVPKGLTFRDLRFEFVTQRAYGTGVMQKEPRELLALRQAVALLRRSAD